MSEELITVDSNPPDPNDAALDALLTQGDLSKLSMAQRNTFLIHLCRKMGLNPATKPFDFIVMNGKLVLYASKGCADQLRKIHRISLEVLYEGPLKLGENLNPEVYVVRARASFPDGRFDEDFGAVGIKGLSGEGLSNAVMKCITKAKRRVTLSVVGLGILDEVEVQGMGNNQLMFGNNTIPDGPRKIAPSLIEPQEGDVNIVNGEVVSSHGGNGAASPKKYPPAAAPVSRPKVGQ